MINFSVLKTLETQGLLSKLERVGGAGFKVLKCLEGAAAYVFASAGCKKWDTAAPEAILKAAGCFLFIFNNLFYRWSTNRYFWSPAVLWFRCSTFK